LLLELDVEQLNQLASNEGAVATEDSIVSMTYEYKNKRIKLVGIFFVLAHTSWRWIIPAFVNGQRRAANNVHQDNAL